MANVNIRRDVDDRFYRYKMPAIQAKVEGKGNGIKTVISNMYEIGKALNRPPSYPTKFFGCEVGAQVICDEKNNRYIVNGVHEPYRLQEMLDIFINKFVLCPACKNPETDLVISRDEVISLTCKACGQRKPTDQTHKLVTYILKNAPKKKKKDRSCKEADGGDQEHGNDGELVEARDSDLGEAMLDGKGINENEWAAELSEEAVARRQQDTLGHLTDFLQSNLAVSQETTGDADGDDADIAGADDKTELFATFLENKNSQNAVSHISDDDIVAKIKELEIKPYKAIAILIQVKFSENIMEELKVTESLLKRIVRDKKAQKGLLGGLERLVGLQYPTLQAKLPLVLQSLYNADILEEEVLLYWSTHPSKKYLGSRELAKSLRSSAAPFIQWLQNAESEDDDSEEDDAAEEEFDEDD